MARTRMLEALRRLLLGERSSGEPVVVTAWLAHLQARSRRSISRPPHSGGPAGGLASAPSPIRQRAADCRFDRSTQQPLAEVLVGAVCEGPRQLVSESRVRE